MWLVHRHGRRVRVLVIPIVGVGVVVVEGFVTVLVLVAFPEQQCDAAGHECTGGDVAQSERLG